MKSRYLQILALLAALLLAPAAEGASKLKVYEKGAQMRSGPGLGYEVTAELAGGTPVDLLGESDRWLRVKSASGQVGWLPRAFVLGLEEDTPSEDRTKKAKRESEREAEKESSEARKARKEREREEKERDRREKEAEKQEAKLAKERQRAAEAEANERLERQETERKQAEELARKERERRESEAAEEAKRERIEQETHQRAAAKEQARREKESLKEAERAQKEQERLDKQAEKEKKQREKAEAKAAEKRQPSEAEEVTAEIEPVEIEEYKPLDTTEILDEVVTRIYESGPVAPGVVKPGPEPPAVGVRPSPAPVNRRVPPSIPSPAEVPRIESAWAELPPPSSRATIVEEVVVRVNEDVITKSELDERLRILDQLPSIPGPDGPEAVEQVRSKLLPRMVDERLLMRQAEFLGVNKEKVYLAAKEEFKQKYNLKSDLELITFLDRSGLDMGDFRDILMRNYLPPLVIEKEVRGSLRVSNQDLIDYYETHRAEMKTGERLRLREIVLLKKDGGAEALRARLRNVLSRLDAGDAFEEVAREYSDADTAASGGDLGEISPRELTVDMSRLAARLVEGEITVEPTEYGYHVLFLEERSPSRVLPFEEVEGKIRSIVESREFSERLQEYLSGLRARSYIQVSPKYRDMYPDHLN